MRIVVGALCLWAMGACTLDDSSEPDWSQAEGSDFKLRVQRNTYFKRWPELGRDLLWGTEKCQLFADSTVRSRVKPTLYHGGHYYIDMSTRIPGCEFEWGYVSTADAEFIEPPPPPPLRSAVCSADLPFRECAMLNVVAYAEGTGDSYNIMYSGATFEGYEDHPRRTICAGNYCSSAAGRYQFLGRTWDFINRSIVLEDFGPENQDIAGIFLMEGRGLVDFEGIADKASFANALALLNLEWASLPGSPYGQPTKTVDELWELYLEFHEAAGMPIGSELPI